MLQECLKGKKILLTGATSGIGYEIASQFIRAGANLALVGRTKEKLFEMQIENSKNVIAIPYDLTDFSNMEDIFKICVDKMGKLDAFVHCAGVAENSIIKASDVCSMRCVMELNTFSFVELGKYFSMKKYSSNGSAIVAISSMASILNDSGMVQYSASKAALNSVVKTMSKEFIKRRIRVNAILPAYVNTKMYAAGEQVVEEFSNKVLQRQPLGVIQPENIAYLVEFLISENAKYITGELLAMGAGMAY